MIPETVTAATPGIFNRVRSRATLFTALEEVIALVTAAIDGRRVAATAGQRATEQLTRARAVAQATPLNDLTLLVHLTATRTFLTDGWAPPALIAELNAAIARIHHLARTAPDVFRASGGATGPRLRGGHPRHGFFHKERTAIPWTNSPRHPAHPPRPARSWP